MIPDAMGMVIGREGRNIQAIRHLVMAYATKLQVKIKLEVEEP